MAGRDSFPANYDVAPARCTIGINRGKREWCSDGAKYEVAVPLTSVAAIDCNDYDKGPKLANTTGDTVHQKDELWKHELDKLEALISQANEFINLFDARNPTSMDPQSLSLDPDAFHSCTSVVLATPVMPQNFDRNFNGKRLKVNSGLFLAVREEASGTATVWEDDEDEISNLSPVECNALQQGYCDKKLEFIDPIPDGAKSDGRRFPNCGITETESRDRQEKDDALRIGEATPTNSTKCSDEPEYCENHKELINLEIVQHDHPQRRKVLQAIQQFKEEYELEIREGRNTKYPHFQAAKRVKAKGMNISTQKPFGHIPGIQIGDEFSFRAELTIVGLNCQFTPGIDFVTLEGKQYATSVVNSGRYENETKENNILIYYGQGGDADQKLEKGNLALVNTMKMGYPVRVIHKRNTSNVNKKHDYKYFYDGLYTVNRFWQERENQHSKLIFKFELQRLPNQPCFHDANVELGKEKIEAVNHGKEVCLLDDLSQGKEKFKVRVMNGEDEDLPPSFNYVTNVLHPPHWFQWCVDTGCDCIDGCSDSTKCRCVVRNGGEIPFNEKGLIMRARTKNAVHECGPSCKCPPTCMNRVSQHGPRFELEIFKTKSTGWGVRSRDYIAPGSFICEYIGELVREKEANERVCEDEYLFDIRHGHGKSEEDGFALDAAKSGNIGRFINHSCEPNVFAQKVVYGDDEERVPHIMFFAGKRIPIGRELRYDYNYSKMSVCDADGNIKRKPCYCGSRKCSGRLY